MNIVRWDPFRELEDVSVRLNRFLNRPEKGEEALIVADWAPMVDIQETDKEYLVKAELPEVKKEDVKVSLENGLLTLRGERHQVKDDKNAKFHRIERSYGTFVRSFSVPTDVDEAKVVAEFKDGVLNVHLTKAQVSKPKNFDIKVA